MNNIKSHKEVNLPGITGGFQLHLPVNYEVRFLLVLLLFSLLISPEAEVKLDAIPSVINYLDVTFHQNGVIADNALEYSEFSIDLYHFYGGSSLL